MQLIEGTLLQEGKYRIEGILGQGGFGITYLGWQTRLNRRVAIKEFFMKEYCNRNADTSHITIGTEGSRELVARFQQKFIKEAQSIAGLNHPNIIRIHDVFEENDTAYYVMEYIEGGSLQEYVTRYGALQETEALHYIHQIAGALNYIHQRQMSHLDVKPGNILRREEGEVVLIDFGLSKRYDESGQQTSTTPVGISTGYAPMEQYVAGGVQIFTPTTDIYSLGATLYKLLTGTTPPAANIVFDDGLPALPANISATTERAIRAAMQPKRQRPQSIKDFLELLNKPEREDITIIAKKEKLPPQKQPSSSNKLPIFIGVVVALLLATVVWFTQKPSDTTPLKEEAFATEVIPTENNPVDLGLSVKWAAYNVGASSPEEYGGLYGWADPTGEKKATNSSDSLSGTPPFNISGTQYDIARAKWGEKWRLPTQQELKEISDKCIWKWTEYKKVAGYMVTGPNGNRIFLPASGYCYAYGGTVYGRGRNGRYWSGTRKTANSTSSSASSLVFSINGWSPLYSDYCKEGNSVRPVSE